jgi:hypothetical protein
MPLCEHENPDECPNHGIEAQLTAALQRAERLHAKAKDDVHFYATERLRIAGELATYRVDHQLSTHKEQR